MKLKVGGYYKDSTGKKCGPIRYCGPDIDWKPRYAYKGSGGALTEDGLNSGYGFDLVSEWVDEGKPLSELNPQEGDVFMSRRGGFYTYRDGEIDNWSISVSNDWWTVISRANTPVKPVLFKDMSDAEQGALLLAQHRGETIEVSCGGGWCKVGKPVWSSDTFYRIAPTRITGTVELTNGEPDFTTWEKSDD
jgi:hypothetical protein